MSKSLLAAALAAAPVGASAARLFAGLGPRIALERPNEGGAGALELKTLIDGFKTANDKVKEIAEKALAEADKAGRLTEETKKASDDKLTEFYTKATELGTRMLEVEQKMARPGGATVERKSLGELFVESDKAKSLLGGAETGARGTVHVSIETKNITSAPASWGATPSATNSLVTPTRAETVALQMRPFTIRDLVSPGQTSSNAVEYAVQTLRANNAAPVAEGQAKPYSDLAWDLRSLPVRTIAHMFKASRQIMDDVPALRSLIDAEAVYGLQFAEEVQFLYGNGTGANILGMVPQATAYAAPFAVDGEQAIDRIRLAMLQGVLALYPMTATILNPLDWARIEMIKDGMGRYLIGNPQGQVQPLLWNLPVVQSLALTGGTFLTGAFKYAVQIFDRMAIEIMMSTENVDDFERNMISIRAEERLALVVKRPGALITGNLP